MWVKICGITRPEDAMLARELGADAVGFVFTGSPRRASPDVLLPWIRKMTGVEKVGVFMDEGVGEILQVCEGLGLDTIQIHAEPMRGHELLTGRYRIIYARDGYQGKRLSEIPCRVLIDASRGSGTQSAWEEMTIPFILAGGLTPENVREAIRRAKPAGVDVSSGVEEAPGVKDPALMERFIREAKS